MRSTTSVTVTAHFGADLAVWGDLTSLPTLNFGDEVSFVSVRSPQPIENSFPPYRFFRVQVTIP